MTPLVSLGDLKQYHFFAQRDRPSAPLNASRQIRPHRVPVQKVRRENSQLEIVFTPVNVAC